MDKKVKVGIVGAAGYTAGELLRILANHSGVAVSYLASDSSSGSMVDKIHPFLRNVVDLELKPYEPQEIAKNCKLVFLAKPHPSSFKFAKELSGLGVKLIDLSGVFRIHNVKVFEDWYGVKHECPELLSGSVYGLPELYYEEIRQADFVANPGCYPAGVILGLAPLFKKKEGAGLSKKIVETDGIIINSVSGFSGAGRSKQNENNLAASVVDNIKPYKITTHPHTPEIEQELGRLLGEEEIKVTFVPHVAGFERGIISTMYLKLAGLMNQTPTKDELCELYTEFYKGKPFVRVYTEGNPEIKNVVYTNFCDIGIDVNKRTGIVIVTTALDNLVKGASGEAVQNMNIMLGYDEGEGLK